MNRFPWVLVFLVVVGAFLSGVFPLDIQSKVETATPVHAREKRVLPASAARSGVTRWKQVDAKQGSYGLIVEEEGNKVSAYLYKLEAAEGLVIREQEATGAFSPSHKGILFPLYNPPDITAQRWVKDGGPHLVVPWPAEGDKLAAFLHQGGRGQPKTVHFVRLWFPTPDAARTASLP